MTKNKTNGSSDTLLALVKHHHFNADLTYQAVLQMLGERAFGIAFLFFALPSALPFSAIPGVSFIFSLPIAVFAAQMVLARKTLWLPKRIAEYRINHHIIAKVIHTAVPYLIKIEHFSKPRWALMTCRVMEIMNGLTIFCLALLLMLPIPFSNPVFSITLIIFSFGLIEKDGVFITLGYIMTILYISFIYFTILMTIKTFFHH